MDASVSEGPGREKVCACAEPLRRQGLDEEDVTVRVTVFGEARMAPIDTAALSIW